MGTRTDPWPDGTPCWVDLAAADVDAARDFLRRRHGLGLRGFRRTPAHWSCYFAVADADATARVATEHGGSVTGGVRDSAYGRIATITDPYGATFAVIGLGEGS